MAVVEARCPPMRWFVAIGLIGLIMVLMCFDSD